MICRGGRPVAGFGLGAPPPPNVPVCGLPGIAGCDRFTLPAGHRYVIGLTQLYSYDPGYPLSTDAQNMIAGSAPLSDYMDPVDWVRALAPADNLGAASPQAPWALPIGVQGFVKRDFTLISSARQTWEMVAQVPDQVVPGAPPTPPVTPPAIARSSSSSSSAMPWLVVLGLVGVGVAVAVDASKR